MRRYGRGRGQGGINRTNQLGFTVAASALICAFWYKLSSRLVVGNSMKGKKVIVTGANTGIGFIFYSLQFRRAHIIIYAMQDMPFHFRWPPKELRL